jgi:hypothetical protein
VWHLSCLSSPQNDQPCLWQHMNSESFIIQFNSNIHHMVLFLPPKLTLLSTSLQQHMKNECWRRQSICWRHSSCWFSWQIMDYHKYSMTTHGPYFFMGDNDFYSILTSKAKLGSNVRSKCLVEICMPVPSSFSSCNCVKTIRRVKEF